VPIELDERDIGKLRRGAQLAGAQRGRRASDAAKVAFDRIETFGQPDGSHEARALDAEYWNWGLIKRYPPAGKG